MLARFFALATIVSLAAPTIALGQQYDPAKMLAEQAGAMAPLEWMNGEWQGEAWVLGGGGNKIDLTQTERIGPMLGGTIKIIEGRGFAPDGTVTFNAFAVLSFDPSDQTYAMRSYSAGQQGTFPLVVTETGYKWEIPMGKSTMRYTAVLADGGWTESGELVAPGVEPKKVFEMVLHRRGDTSWPAAGALTPQ